MVPQEVTEFFGKQFTKLKATKNVLSPLQYFMWTAVVACTLGMTQGPPEFRTVFLITLLFCFAYFLFFYGYFAFRNPARLQTEEHNEAMTYITGGLQDDRGALVDITPTSNTAVASGSIVVAHSQAPTSLQQMPAGVPSTANPGGQPSGTSGGGIP